MVQEWVILLLISFINTILCVNILFPPISTFTTMIYRPQENFHPKHALDDYVIKSRDRMKKYRHFDSFMPLNICAKFGGNSISS